MQLAGIAARSRRLLQRRVQHSHRSLSDGCSRKEAIPGTKRGARVTTRETWPSSIADGAATDRRPLFLPGMYLAVGPKAPATHTVLAPFVHCVDVRRAPPDARNPDA